MDSEALRRYLDRVEGNLQGPGKGEILREIESHVMDRAEALAHARGGEVVPEDVDRAIEELGDPSELAVSYSGEKYLVAPREYAAYWYFTLLVFAVHATMLLVAFVTRSEFEFFPFNVLPAGKMQGAGAVLILVSLTVQAFLFDAGLVGMVFFLLRRSFRRVDLPALTFRVESSRRPSLVRALFAVVLGVLLGVPAIRDRLFVVRYGEGPAGAHSFFLPEWGDVVPFILAFLALSVAKDLLYALLRERTLTVALDTATAGLATALSVFLFASGPLVGLPPDFPMEEATLVAFNDILSRVVSMALLLLAALYAARLVKRAVRVRQLWGERDAARL